MFEGLNLITLEGANPDPDILLQRKNEKQVFPYS